MAKCPVRMKLNVLGVNASTREIAMSDRPKYKELYEREKRRREFYEKLKPDLLRLWAETQERRLRLLKDIEHAILR